LLHLIRQADKVHGHYWGIIARIPVF
jgi:hypothetical protein